MARWCTFSTPRLIVQLQDIERELSKVNPWKVTRPNGKPGKVLIACADQLFNLSLTQTLFQPAWILHLSSPFQKKPPTTNPNDLSHSHKPSQSGWSSNTSEPAYPLLWSPPVCLQAKSINRWWQSHLPSQSTEPPRTLGELHQEASSAQSSTPSSLAF